MKRLKDKTAIVTGAAQGMGEAEARLFVDHGARVVVADIDEDLGRSVADDIGEAACFGRLDVADERGWAQTTKLALDRFGSVDVLVNNAGVNRPAPMQELPMEAYRRIVDVDQTGVWLGIRAVAPHMRERGGSIVNISSDAGLFGMPMVAAYSAAKFAVRGITRSAAVELAPDGIRVNSVHPGFIDTQETRPAGIADALRADGRALGMGVPLHRIGTPREVANLVLFLASDESSYCTGAEFVVDGGIMAGPVAE